MKKRLAIFMHGGISGGYGSQGFPGIVMLVDRLSDYFDLAVYSIAYSKEKGRRKYRIYSAPRWVPLIGLRVIWLLTIFCIHHIRHRYDSIFAFWGYPAGALATFLGKIFRKRSLAYYLGGETANVPEINYGHLRKLLSRSMVLWTSDNVEVLIVLTLRQAQAIEKFGCNKSPHIIPFGVDKTAFYPLSKSWEPPLKIIHVANLTPVKDQETLIRTFEVVLRSIPAKLRIVGPDYMDGKIQALVRESGLDEHVEFTGPVLHSEMVHNYHWADLCLITSLSEGQNTSLTEAMMCGVLPASTEVGMMDNVLGTKLGIVAPCKDYEQLGRRIVEHYQNRALWEQKKSAAQVWANAHDLEWTVNRLTSLIHHGRDGY